MACAPRDPPKFIAIPGKQLIPIILDAKARPHGIDALFRRKSGTLLDPAFVNTELLSEFDDLTNGVTPPLYWGGDPSKTPRYYGNCTSMGTIIGRAFAAVSPVTETERAIDISPTSQFGKGISRLPVELRLQIFEQHALIVAQRQRIWAGLMAPVFIKALFSGRDPEPGARFLAAMFILTAGHAISLLKDQITTKGRQWNWFNATIEDPDATWTVEDLFAAVLATDTTLPRDNWNWVELEKFYATAGQKDRPEYVSKECVVVMDAAREKLRADGSDWSSEKVYEVHAREWKDLWERMACLNREPLDPSVVEPEFEYDLTLLNA